MDERDQVVESSVEADPSRDHQSGQASEAGERDPEAVDVSDDTARLRELIVRAHPNVVPELIQGTSLGEMLSSVPAAEAAFSQIAEQVGGTALQPAVIPAGGGVRTANVDIDGLSPLAKIRAGLT